MAKNNNPACKECGEHRLVVQKRLEGKTKFRCGACKVYQTFKDYSPRQPKKEKKVQEKAQSENANKAPIELVYIQRIENGKKSWGCMVPRCIIDFMLSRYRETEKAKSEIELAKEEIKVREEKETNLTKQIEELQKEKMEIYNDVSKKNVLLFLACCAILAMGAGILAHI